MLAAQPTRLLRLASRGFQHVLQTHDALALRVYRAFNRVLAARLRDTTARLSRGSP